jgi:IclR family acetate operon transcriptional repressor
MGLVKFTSKSILDPKRFFKEVEETKKKSYAIDDEEYIPGVRAVAAPILAASPPPAAIWVVGFSSSLNDQKMQKVVLEIRKSAEDISRTIREH